MSLLSRPPQSRARARQRRHARYRRLALALVAAVITLGAFFALTSGARDRTQLPVACLNKSDPTLRTTLTNVARRLYLNEHTRYGSVLAAIKSVTSDARLAQDVAEDDLPRTEDAVIELIYNHRHIVRLRITRKNHVLADVGGSLVLAPMAGQIRYAGHTVGHYLLSIQDDLGYELLAAREAGLKVVMSTGGRRVLSDAVDAPLAMPVKGTLTLDGVRYVTSTLNATGFPNGPLHISVLAPIPAGPYASLSCQQLKANTLTAVAKRIATQVTLSPTDDTQFVHLVHSLTEATVLVTHGAHAVGASVGAPNQPPLGTGPILLHNEIYNFASFATNASNGAPLRVYVFVR